MERSATIVWVCGVIEVLPRVVMFKSGSVVDLRAAEARPTKRIGGNPWVTWLGRNVKSHTPFRVRLKYGII